jgi:hypothetical protein
VVRRPSPEKTYTASQSDDSGSSDADSNSSSTSSSDSVGSALESYSDSSDSNSDASGDSSIGALPLKRESPAATLKAMVTCSTEWQQVLTIQSVPLEAGLVLATGVGDKDHRTVMKEFNRENALGPHRFKIQAVHKDRFGNIIGFSAECPHSRGQRKRPSSSGVSGEVGRHKKPRLSPTPKRHSSGGVSGEVGRHEKRRRSATPPPAAPAQTTKPASGKQTKRASGKREGPRSKRRKCNMRINFKKTATNTAWTIGRLHAIHTNHPQYDGVRVGHLDKAQVEELTHQTVDLALGHESTHLAANASAGAYVPQRVIKSVRQRAKALIERRKFEEALAKLRDLHADTEMMEAVVTMRIV